MSKEIEASSAKKKKKKWPWIVIAAVVVIVIGSAVSGGNGAGANTSSTVPSSVSNNEPATNASTPVDSSKQASAAETKNPYSITLGPGYYEIGTDIPAGTYDFEITSGSGNVTDVNDGINLIMGKQSDDMYQKTYNNAKLTDGSTLFLQQCSIKISSKSADTNLKKRDNSTAKTTSLSSGNYVAGTDFQPGYYDITLSSGQGNVICMENQLNAIFSTDSSFGVKEYKNVKFETGNKLQVEGAKINLTPSK